MWALGIMMYELIINHPAYSENRPLIRQVKAGNVYYGSGFDSLTTWAQEFLRYLLDVDAHRRPSANEALSHPWLRCASHTSSMAQQAYCKPVCPQANASELSMQAQDQLETQFNATHVDGNGRISAVECCNAMMSSLGIDALAAQLLCDV